MTIRSALAASAAMRYLFARGKAPARGNAAAAPRYRLSWQSPLLALVLVTMALAGIWSYAYLAAMRSVNQTANDNLTAVATIKVRQIEDWLSERRADARLLTHAPQFADTLPVWLKGGLRDDRQREILARHLRALTINAHYRDVTLRSATDGALLLSSGGDLMDTPAVRAQAKASATQMRALLEDIHFTYPGSPDLDLGIFCPITVGADPRPVAILHITLDPAALLFPLLDQWPGISPSAETYLVRSEGDQVLYLSNLRHRPDSALRFSMPHDTPGLLAAQASDTGGALHGVDYRSVPSLGYVLPVAGTPWFLVAEIDDEEVHGQLERMAQINALIAALLLLVGAWWIAERNRSAFASHLDHLARTLLAKRIDFLAKYANDCILLSDAHGRIIEVNDRGLATYGYTRQEMIGMNLADIRSPRGQARLADAPETRSLIYETEHRCKDGRLFPVEVSTHPIDIAGETCTQEIVRDIGPRLASEAALRDSEARFRQLFDLAPVGMAIVSLDGRIESGNTALLRMTGFDAQRLRTMSLSDLSHPDNQGKELELLRQLVAGETSHYSLEKRILRADGQVLWVLASATLVKDNTDTPVYAIVQYLDMSERRQFTARIERLSRLYSAISGANQAIIHSTSPQEVFHAVCRACVELGRLRLAWIGIADTAAQRIVPVEAAGEALGFLDGLVISTNAESPEGRGPTGTAYREQRIYCCNDYFADPNTQPWYHRAAQFGLASSISLPLLRGGISYGALTVYGEEKGFFDTESIEILREMAENISFAIDHFDQEIQRRQAEEQLTQYAEQIEDLYQNAPCGYHSIDADGLIIRINATELRWLGYAEDEVTGRMRITDLMSDTGRHKFHQTFPQLKAGQPITDLESELVRKDGTILPVALSASAVKDGDGNFMYSRTTVYDITERRKVEQERALHAARIQALSHRLVAIQESERRRLAEALHDQTSPNLAATAIMLGTLAKSLPPQAPAALRASLEDARALLDDTALNVREICANLRPSLLDYSGLAPSLAGYAQQFSRRTGIAVRVSAHDASARLAPDVESLLFRITQEALTNCAKHSGARSIEVELALRDRRVMLTVADDGAGFAQDKLGQAGRMPGLGLITMRERAEFAGGTFSIESQPGKGTKIVVELDCAQALRTPDNGSPSGIYDKELQPQPGDASITVMNPFPVADGTQNAVSLPSP